MDQAVAGLIGAVIGAGAGILGGLVVAVVKLSGESAQFRRELRMELDKESRANRLNQMKELRAQIADVGIKMMAAQHSMEWLCWHADVSPEHVTKETSTAYERELHSILPELLGTMAVLAALDYSAYERLLPLSERIYDMDEAIATAHLQLDDSREECIRDLKSMYGDVSKLYRQIPAAITETLRSSVAAS